MSKVIELAIALSGQFETAKRNDGKEYLRLREDDKYSQWMQDVIFAGHLDTMPNDESYLACQKIIDTIAELDASAFEDDEVLENLDEIEPSCYTSDLTSWLNSNNSYVYYLTEALEELDIKDGFQLLTYANSIWLREMTDAIVSKLIEIAEADLNK
jgi:hypothetical protein